MSNQSRRERARSKVKNSSNNNQGQMQTDALQDSLITAYLEEASEVDETKKQLTKTEIFQSLKSIDEFIGRTYLRSITNSRVVPLTKTISRKGKTIEVFNIPGEPTVLPSYRWFRIDKVVYEKNVFFADKFSMLFAALHDEAAQVALVLDKKDGIIKLYLGARDNNDRGYNLSGETLEAALNGFLTGVHTTSINDDDVKNIFSQYTTPAETPAVACVSGVASLRDDKKDEFVQGLERLINSTSTIRSFSAFFIADSVSEQEKERIVNAFQRIYRQISPFEEFQTSLSKSETESLTNTITEGITSTIGKTIGRTITNGTTYTTSETKTKGKSVTDGTSSGWNSSRTSGSTDTYSPFGVGGSSNRSYTEGESRGKSHSETVLKQLAQAISKGDLHQASDLTQQIMQDAKTKQTSQAKATGSSISNTLQVTTKDLHVKDLMETIEFQIKRLRNAAPFGLWNCATYFVSSSESTSREIAGIYKGTIIGEESGLEETTINSWGTDSSSNNEILRYLRNGINPRFIVDGQNVSAGTTVSSKELAIHMALPQSSVPGIVVQTRASFGRSVTRYSSYAEETEDITVDSKTNEEHSQKNESCDQKIKLGCILNLGEIDKKNLVCLNLDDLTRHTFVTGTTGSGKSNVMYLILNSLHEKGKKFLVIEPQKGEYKKVLGGLDGVSVYGSNPYESKLLTINPFSFDYEKGVMLYEHVNRLVEIFNACWPMYAAMPAVLKKSILDAYKSCGWNTKLSKPLDYGHVLFPRMEDVIMSLRKFINKSEYSADSKSDYKGAIETRLMDLAEGTTGLMLNSGREISSEELFDENVIVDLHRIGNSETISLIMGMLVLKLNEYRMNSCGMNEHVSHVTVLEEAHNILKRAPTTQIQESSNLIGKSVEMISNSIAEMRTYGEGFIIIDQSPAQIDLSAIRNTNTKIILALPDVEDCRTAGKSIGLSDEQIEEINKQKVGQAIVYQNDWEEPVQCAIDEFNSYKPYTSQKDNEVLNEALDFHPNVDIIKFLIAGKLNIGPSFDLDSVIENLSKTSMSSITKFAIYQMVDEYNKTGICRIWESDSFKDLSALVAAYINMDDEIEAIMCEKSQADINELTNSIAHLFRDDLSSLSQGEILTVVQCLLKHQSAKSRELQRTYNRWINN